MWEEEWLSSIAPFSALRRLWEFVLVLVTLLENMLEVP